MPSTQLTNNELSALNTSLHYCKVEELKKWCQQLSIPHTGEKPQLIERITHFAQTGTIPISPQIPQEARKKPGISYPLQPETPMAYGAFKNDLQTRLFLKKLIGNHFHYTVFGLDWLKEQWHLGKQPAYAEFATFWQAEYLRRQGKQQDLKPEWAYLNFAREFKNTHPHASKHELLTAWETIHLEHKRCALALLQKRFPHTL